MPADSSSLALSLVAGTALAVEAAGSALLLGYILFALLALARQHGLERCRLLLADGAVTSLGFKTAASLLKTLELNTWHQIGAFMAVLALRTVLKRAFVAEKTILTSTCQRGSHQDRRVASILTGTVLEIGCRHRSSGLKRLKRHLLH